MFYSQSGEDEYLNNNIFSGHRGGVFCELGALDGVKYSNTKYFEDSMGWSGHLIEPDPVSFSLLTENRPNCRHYNYAITQTPGDVELLMGGNHAVSCVKEGVSDGFFERWHQNSSVVTVPGRKMRDVISFEDVPRLDLLSVDVEGREIDVFSTFDWRIKVDWILFETIEKFHRETNALCRELLKGRGYRYVSRVAHNDLWTSLPE